MLERGLKRFATILALLCFGCDKPSIPATTHEIAPEVYPTTKALADKSRSTNCDEWISAELKVPKRFIPVHCETGRVRFWMPDKLFDEQAFKLEINNLVVTHTGSNDPLTLRAVDPKWFNGPGAKQLQGGLARIADGGSQGFDSVLESEIIPYLFLDRRTGVVCQSSNMRMDPRAFMVRCGIGRYHASFFAWGPQDSVVTISKRLAKIANELDPTTRKP